MSGEELFKLLGDIDEQKILEAYEVDRKVKKVNFSSSRLLRYGTLVASILLVLVVISPVVMQNLSSKGGSYNGASEGYQSVTSEDAFESVSGGIGSGISDFAAQGANKNSSFFENILDSFIDIFYNKSNQTGVSVGQESNRVTDSDSENQEKGSDISFNENDLYINSIENVNEMRLDSNLELLNFETITDENERLKVLDNFENEFGFSLMEYRNKFVNLASNLNMYVLVNSDNSVEHYIHDYILELQGENIEKLTISICSFEEPFRDYFILDDPSKVSTINGIEVIIFEYEDKYIVNFTFEGAYYDIEATNVNIEQLEKFLIKLLK